MPYLFDEKKTRPFLCIPSVVFCLSKKGTLCQTKTKFSKFLLEGVSATTCFSCFTSLLDPFFSNKVLVVLHRKTKGAFKIRDFNCKGQEEASTALKSQTTL